MSTQTSPRRAARTTARALGVAFLTVLATACGDRKDPPPPPGSAPDTLAVRRKAFVGDDSVRLTPTQAAFVDSVAAADPHERHAIITQHALGGFLRTLSDSAQRLYFAPENGDAQELLNDARNAHGPYAQIWPTAHAAGHESFDAYAGNGLVVAQIYVLPGTPPDSYVHLKLSRGDTRYCLTLQKANGNTLNAYVWPAESGGVCPRNTVMQDQFKLANVRVDHPQGHEDPEDFPGVARWSEGRVQGGNPREYSRRRPAIDVPCAKNWCTILPDGVHHLSPGHEGKFSGTPPRKSFGRGWYDEHVIAKDRSLAPFILASVIPHDTLGRMNDEAAGFNDWVRVATIYIDDDNTTAPDISGWKYSSALRRGLNTVEIRKRTGEAPDSEQWGEIRFNGGTPLKKFVRRAHPGLQMAGTARWAWEPSDEDVWFRCADGCCYASLGDS